MSERDEMLRLARAEIGYQEKPGNITKYWDELTAVNWFDGMNKQGGAWCMGFQCWLALKVAGNKEEGRKLLCQTGPLGACCDDQVRYFKNAGRFFDAPELADLVFFDYDPEKNNGEDHVGLVDEILSYGFYSIEGNSHDAVRRNFYYFGDSDIAGFGRPRFGGNFATESTSNNVASVSTSASTEGRVEPNRGLYEVKQNDTLSQIAEDAGCSVSDLVEWNNIADPNVIYVGQILRINKKESITVEQRKEKSYTVRSGDTLSEIAEDLQCSVSDLAKWNDIEDINLIFPGQVLKIK